MEIKKIKTRFRAYQLGNEGSSFSYSAGNHFTLIEARLNEINKLGIDLELKLLGKDKIDVLHITSWDTDHCKYAELEEILKCYEPKKIEYPGYAPHTESGENCLKLIKKYKKDEDTIEKVKIDTDYVKGLSNANLWEYNNVIYNNNKNYDDSNNNSTIKLFRSGSFTVASLGDVEAPEIREMLMRSEIFLKEVDVMILAHHGADNGFTNSEFLSKIKPTVAICSSNYDNQYEHPKKEIRDILYKNDIPVFTTKTGDVVIVSVSEHDLEYEVINLISNSEKISSRQKYKAKR